MQKTYTLFSLFLATTLLFSACEEKNNKAPKSKNEPQKVVRKPKPKQVEEYKPRFTDETIADSLLAFGKTHKQTKARIKTSMGTITIKLFEDTPLHRANFIMIAETGYFDSTVFNRVVPNFMAQCGSGFVGRHTDLRRELGYYTIPPEFSKTHFHKRGAVAMAREYKGNPEKRSNPFAFYFVEGTRFSNETLDIYEKQNGYKYTQEQRNYYTKNPGAAHIDGQHTVFGEIIDGYEVVPKLTSVKTDGQDWPYEDIFILEVEILD